MILIVGSTKGGVGKTTLAFNFAIALANVGRDVLLIDADKGQSTATINTQIRTKQLGKTGFTAVSLYGEALILQVPQLAKKYDDVVIGRMLQHQVRWLAHLIENAALEDVEARMHIEAVRLDAHLPRDLSGCTAADHRIGKDAPNKKPFRGSDSATTREPPTRELSTFCLLLCIGSLSGCVSNSRTEPAYHRPLLR